MEIKIVQVESKPALAISTKCSFAELSGKFDEIYSEIGSYIKKNNLKVIWGPFGIYHSVSPEEIDLEAGFPVEGNPKSEGRIKLMQTYSGKAVMTTYTGPYEKLKEVWGVFSKLVDAEGHKIAGPCFEVYITDPGEEPDSSKWITELYTPIE